MPYLLPPNDRCATALLTSLDGVLNSVVASLVHLWLEIKVDKLSLLRCPLSVGVSVENQLVASCISDLSSGVRECTIGAPLNVVAC